MCSLGFLWCCLKAIPEYFRPGAGAQGFIRAVPALWMSTTGVSQSGQPAGTGTTQHTSWDSHTAATMRLGSLCWSGAHYPARVTRQSITHRVLITLEGWLREPPQIPTYPRAYLPAAAVYTCGAFTTLQWASHGVWEPPKAAVSKQRTSGALPSPMGTPHLLYSSRWPHGCVWNTQVPSLIGATIGMSEVPAKGQMLLTVIRNQQERYWLHHTMGLPPPSAPLAPPGKLAGCQAAWESSCFA